MAPCRISMGSMSLLLVLYFIFLIGIPVAVSMLAPINPALIEGDVLAASGFGLGSVLVAVIAILLVIFDSKNLRDTKAGKPFLVMVYMLCGAVIASFFVGLASLWVDSYTASNVSRETLAYVLIASAYTVVAGVLGAAIRIVGWW
jgi:hypothetical protein